jgi:DNA-binding transcriptional LysR family regulator
MPRPIGSDRVRELADRIELTTLREKGWRPRTEPEFGRPPHPGTAVEWEDVLYEVVAIEPVPAGGFRYILQPWEPACVIRLRDAYDEASEALRRAEREDLRRRESRRSLAIAGALLYGHLPAVVQERMYRDYGTPRALPTIISALPPFAVGVWCLIFFIAGSLAGKGQVPPLVLLLGVYLFPESLVRAGYAATTGSPLGSFAGVVAWGLYSVATGKIVRAAPPPALAGPAIPPETARLDAFRLREPFVPLLPESEQWRFHEGYGFDPVAAGKKNAAVILALVGAALGVQVAGFAGGDADGGRLLAFLVNLYFAGEQIARLVNLSQGRPMGSVLGFLIRPLLRGL